MIILLLVMIFNHFQPATAVNATIYILEDGQLNPHNTSILRKGDTYIFTDNISDEVVVEKNNIIIDGNGYTLEGLGFGTGISLCGRENVTVKNLQIKNFSVGISLGGLGSFSYYNNIANNNITKNTCNGLYLDYYSNYNNITYNILAENNNGIYLYCSSNNNISRNNIIANSYDGISLSYSSNDNLITENNIERSWYGITLEHVANNMFYQNNFVENIFQVHSSLSATTWDNGCLGNYWGDYEGSDTNENIIHNKPYVIKTENIDHFPLTRKQTNYPSYLPQSIPNSKPIEQKHPTPQVMETPSSETTQPTVTSPEPSKIPQETIVSNSTAASSPSPEAVIAAFPWTLSVIILAVGTLILSLIYLLGKGNNPDMFSKS